MVESRDKRGRFTTKDKAETVLVLKDGTRIVAASHKDAERLVEAAKAAGIDIRKEVEAALLRKRVKRSYGRRSQPRGRKRPRKLRKGRGGRKRSKKARRQSLASGRKK